MNKPLIFSPEAQEQLIEISNSFHSNDGQKEVTTNSLKVAKHFGKNHRDILRALRRLDCSSDFRQRNFAQSSYINEQGKNQPMFEMTKNGFVFLVMGFTGKQAAQFKESYINAFDEMSDLLKSQNLNLISEFNKAVMQYEHASNIASQAGRTLSLVGKQFKPKAAEKVAELERQLQPLLFGENENENEI